MDIRAVDHVGIRVSNLERSLAFYAKLGFDQIYTDEKDPVAIVKNAAGVELNLIHNAASESAEMNVLMDVDTKHPGYTHVALQVGSIEKATQALGRVGIPLSGGPERLGDGVSIFVRDPDRTVIEFRESV